MLKFTIDKESFEALNEVEKTFYKENGDNYSLQVDGAVDKSKLDEFRSTNVSLMKEAEKFKDVDLVKYNELKEKERKNRDKELIDKKDFDLLLSENTASMKSDLDAKIANLENELNGSKASYTSLISKHEIEGAANTAFTKHKILPDAHNALMAEVRNKFSINNGSVVSMNGESIELGADGNLTVDEFISNQPEMFKIQSSGGGGQGSDNSTASKAGSSSQDKYKSGLKKLMG